MIEQIPTADITSFRVGLMNWYDPKKRPMPWKEEKNPYFIWLSEIILQQTRVEQGLPYYQKFVQQYPKVEDLAKAPDDEVMKLWEGLGYYSRARNLLSAARYIHQELDGKFPNTYEDILQLKGVGPYTAAAIASFAFNLPRAVLDGNVYRVLSRFFGIDTPVDSSAGKKDFAYLSQAALDQSQAAIYNQAIMDFGATVCKPKNPDCRSCPFNKNCKALTGNQIENLPVKIKRIKKRTRFFYFLRIEKEGSILLQQRQKKDIWQGLYQFPLLELEGKVDNWEEIRQAPLWQSIFGNASLEIENISKPFQQRLTHQKIIGQFLKINLETVLKTLPEASFWHPLVDVKQFAFPKIIDWYLGDNSLYLNLK